MAVSETQLQQDVADYIRMQYPDVLFHSDYGSGVKLTPRQAAIQKRQNGGRRAWPDMFIAMPRHIMSESNSLGIYIGFNESNGIRYYSRIVAGLFIELKKEGEKLFPGPRATRRYLSKDGITYKTEHLMEQANTLFDLRDLGYCAEFAVGFDEAKRIIDNYLGGK